MCVADGTPQRFLPAGNSPTAANCEQGQQRHRDKNNVSAQQLTQDAVVQVTEAVGEMPGMSLMVDAGTALCLHFKTLMDMERRNHHHRHKHRQQQPCIGLSFYLLSHKGIFWK